MEYKRWSANVQMGERVHGDLHGQLHERQCVKQGDAERSSPTGIRMTPEEEKVYDDYFERWAKDLLYN